MCQETANREVVGVGSLSAQAVQSIFTTFTAWGQLLLAADAPNERGDLLLGVESANTPRLAHSID
jgi:hypothetical protein